MPFFGGGGTLNKYTRIAIALAVFGTAFATSHFGIQQLFSGDDKVSITSVAVGDCLTDIGTANTIQDATKVVCSKTHDAEVFAMKQINSDAADVPADVDVQANNFCRSEFEGFVGVSYDVSKLEIITTFPLAEYWKTGDHGITCLVGKPNFGTTRGTLKNSQQ
jgi:hypothetical protein